MNTRPKIRYARLVIAAACVAGLAGCSEKESLPPIASSKEAVRVVTELENAGISDIDLISETQDRKVVWVVKVPKEQLSAARRLMCERDLPRESTDVLEALRQSSGMMPSAADEANRQRAILQSELNQKLELYDRVVSAHVTICPERKESFDSEPATPATASVVIKYLGATADEASDADTPVSAEEVRELVAHSVAGLKAESVRVAFTRTVISPPPAPELAAAPSPATAPEPAQPQTSTAFKRLDTYLPLTDQELLYVLLGLAVIFTVMMAMTWRWIRNSKRTASRKLAPGA